MQTTQKQITLYFPENNIYLDYNESGDFMTSNSGFINFFSFFISLKASFNNLNFTQNISEEQMLKNDLSEDIENCRLSISSDINLFEFNLPKKVYHLKLNVVSNYIQEQINSRNYQVLSDSFQNLRSIETPTTVIIFYKPLFWKIKYNPEDVSCLNSVLRFIGMEEFS